MTRQEFITRWQGSAAAELANSQSFLIQLCRLLDVEEPHPKRFNGGLFEDNTALPVTDDQLELLIEAATARWEEVEPAIFGTLLERALDPVERHKLGAHYTPRAYVERLVMPTIIEPLREDWETVYATAVKWEEQGKPDEARREIRAFHAKLCNTRVLDPACGSGNFLYVSLELMKRLEGEVLNELAIRGEEILQRLVDLNHERAAEEEKGLVRWLRPEFQCPEGPQKTQQQLDITPADVAKVAARPATAKKQKWPATLPERMQALKAALEQQPVPASAGELAGQFRGGRNRAATIEELLDTLVAIGQARQTDDGRYAA